MSNPAQDEASAMFSSQNEKPSRHPADSASEHSEPDSEPEPDTAAAGSSSSNGLHSSSAYHIPKSTTAGGNTGPKGVIADARSYERARRSALQQRRKSPNGATAAQSGQGEKSHHSRPRSGRRSDDDDAEDREADDEDEEFINRWRSARLTELRSTPAASQSGRNASSRRQSPSMRRFGRMDTVDAVGYLDAIEKVGEQTVVVVFIYDDESEVSAQVESLLHGLARKHATTHFVRLHYLDAEMDVASTPAVLAYRAGELFANLVAIIDEIPSDLPLSSTVLERVLK
ncbi:MAG: hypothetical protein M1825_005387, partial [Sarcosagium campestre]